jgi:hypothetical protein
MVPRFLTILTGRNLPKFWQSRQPEPSIINEKTLTDFTKVVEKTGMHARIGVPRALNRLQRDRLRAVFLFGGSRINPQQRHQA